MCVAVWEALLITATEPNLIRGMNKGARQKDFLPIPMFIQKFHYPGVAQWLRVNLGSIPC